MVSDEKKLQEHKNIRREREVRNLLESVLVIREDGDTDIRLSDKAESGNCTINMGWLGRPLDRIGKILPPRSVPLHLRATFHRVSKLQMADIACQGSSEPFVGALFALCGLGRSRQLAGALLGSELKRGDVRCPHLCQAGSEQLCSFISFSNISLLLI
jgi:hypothetical protein